MAKKQTATATATAAAAPGRAAKARATRVTTVKHSKSTPIDPSIEEIAADTSSPQPETPVSAALTREDAHAAIAKIAYSYWEARGGAGGSAEGDWIRAESEYLSQLAV